PEDATVDRASDPWADFSRERRGSGFVLARVAARHIAERQQRQPPKEETECLQVGIGKPPPQCQGLLGVLQRLLKLPLGRREPAGEPLQKTVLAGLLLSRQEAHSPAVPTLGHRGLAPFEVDLGQQEGCACGTSPVTGRTV